MADTRELILNAAWELFAEKGFEDVSVRDVTNAAGVNLASVSYHFGGKDGLIQETVKRCLNPVYEYGLQLLSDAKMKYGGVEKIPLEHLMYCWMRPLFMPEDCGVRADLIMRLIARYMIEHNYSVPLRSQQLLAELYQVYTKAFLVHFPHLSAAEVIQLIIFAEGAAVYSTGIGEVITQAIKGEQVDVDRIDREALMQKSVEFFMYGFGGKPV